MNASENVIDLYGADHEHTLAFELTRPGLTVRYNARPVSQIFGKMISEQAFQACEFSLSNYLILKDRGVDWLNAIPVFPNRSFRHNTLHVRRNGNVREPTDLRGRKLGLEDYSMTAAVWLRGTLAEEYGVNWQDIEWCCESEQKRFKAPTDVRISYVKGDPEQMLIDGEVDAIMSFGTRDERKPPAERKLKRLFDDVQRVEQEYYERTNIYPINHCVVIRTDVLQHFPELPKALFDAYSEAKHKAYVRRLGSTLMPWGKQHWTEGFDVFDGDPLPYGLAPTNLKVVGKLARYLKDQSLISRLPEVRSLFLCPDALEPRRV